MPTSIFDSPPKDPLVAGVFRAKATLELTSRNRIARAGLGSPAPLNPGRHHQTLCLRPCHGWFQTPTHRSFVPTRKALSPSGAGAYGAGGMKAGTGGGVARQELSVRTGAAIMSTRSKAHVRRVVPPRSVSFRRYERVLRSSLPSPKRVRIVI